MSGSAAGTGPASSGGPAPACSRSSIRHGSWRGAPEACGVDVDRTEWRITLEPVPEGTRIVQTYDVLHVTPGLDRVYWLLIKAHRDRRDALDQDLRRLAALAERQAPSTHATGTSRATVRAPRGRQDRPVAGFEAMGDMDCDNCGATMRWETSHSRCDRCGHIRPCCEGAPVTASCVVPRAE